MSEFFVVLGATLLSGMLAVAVFGVDVSCFESVILAEGILDLLTSSIIASAGVSGSARSVVVWATISRVVLNLAIVGIDVCFETVDALANE